MNKFFDVSGAEFFESVSKKDETNCALVNFLDGLLDDLGFQGHLYIHSGDITMKHKVHPLTVGTYIDHMLILRCQGSFYLLLPIVQTGSVPRTNVYAGHRGMRQIAIECVNTIVANAIMLGLPIDKPMYGLVFYYEDTISDSYVEVIRIQKNLLDRTLFDIWKSPQLLWNCSAPNPTHGFPATEMTYQWMSCLWVL
ncbi:hypothetical protein P9112_010285 [Eukaryota sp. TZLM1-RC]